MHGYQKWVSFSRLQGVGLLIQKVARTRFSLRMVGKQAMSPLHCSLTELTSRDVRKGCQWISAAPPHFWNNNLCHVVFLSMSLFWLQYNNIYCYITCLIQHCYQTDDISNNTSMTETKTCRLLVVYAYRFFYIFHKIIIILL